MRSRRCGKVGGRKKPKLGPMMANIEEMLETQVLGHPWWSL